MWTPDRRKELESLRSLLSEVSAINRGSHCLDRIARCITMAEALVEHDFGSGRQDFISFLIEEATRAAPAVPT